MEESQEKKCKHTVGTYRFVVNEEGSDELFCLSCGLEKELTINKPTKMKEQSQKCNIIGCEDRAQTRGVCRTHYHSARHLMATGKVTEKELVEKGVFNKNSKTSLTESQGLIFKMLQK